MTFPTVVSSTHSAVSADNTTHSVALSLAPAGNLLLVFIACSAAISPPAGWTQVFNLLGFGLFTGWRRVATGTEGGVASFTTAVNASSAHVCYHISGQTSVPVEAVVAFHGAGSQPDSPDLAPTWGSKDTLWLTVGAVAGNSGGPFGINTVPANYTVGDAGVSDSANQDQTIGVVHRTLAASSENPGVWGFSGSAWSNGGSATVAVLGPEIRTGVLSASGSANVPFKGSSLFDGRLNSDGIAEVVFTGLGTGQGLLGSVAAATVSFVGAADKNAALVVTAGAVVDMVSDVASKPFTMDGVATVAFASPDHSLAVAASATVSFVGLRVELWEEEVSLIGDDWTEEEPAEPT